MQSEKPAPLVRLDPIENAILLMRGHKVILDSDLARLYEVTTGNLNKAVKRNRRRFPEDFMFQLTREEAASLFQSGRAKPGRGGRQTRPYAFTEHGVAMLSSVLNSDRAIDVNIAIMRAFARLREMLAANNDLARRLDDLEKRYDVRFRVVFKAIKELMKPGPLPPRRRVGFRPPSA